eukprot:357666-Chlamydomonas_euryale.AAC.2
MRNQALPGTGLNPTEKVAHLWLVFPFSAHWGAPLATECIGLFMSAIELRAAGAVDLGPLPSTPPVLLPAASGAYAVHPPPPVLLSATPNIMCSESPWWILAHQPLAFRDSACLMLLLTSEIFCLVALRQAGQRTGCCLSGFVQSFARHVLCIAFGTMRCVQLTNSLVYDSLHPSRI